MCKHHFLLKLAQLVIGYYTNRNFHQVLNCDKNTELPAELPDFLVDVYFFSKLQTFVLKATIWQITNHSIILLFNFYSITNVAILLTQPRYFLIPLKPFKIIKKRSSSQRLKIEAEP